MFDSDTIIQVTRHGMGSGPDDLQLALMGKYLELLGRYEQLPAALCFYTDGVKLVVEGSPVLESLEKLEQRGIRLLVCSTCLGYFGLTENVRVGIVGGMTDILEAQQRAGKVITL